MRVVGFWCLKEGVKGKQSAAEMLILGDLFGDGVGTVGLERVRCDNLVLGVEMREVGDVVREVCEELGWVAVK